jgi:hypothetical protein
MTLARSLQNRLPVDNYVGRSMWTNLRFTIDDLKISVLLK